MSAQLEIREVSKAFGGVQAVSRVSLDVPRGEIVSVIGPNGAGKTTLLNMISGFYHPDTGGILLDGVDVTRWREDRTRDCWGQFIYVRDLRNSLVWSVGHQPIGRTADDYEVTYSVDRAEFRRVDAGIETHCEVVVSPENNAELRRVTLTNQRGETILEGQHRYLIAYRT